MADLIFDDIKRGWLFRGVTWESAGVTRRGSFHKWVVIEGRIYAIVELENGAMTTVRMRDIKFNVGDEEGKENEGC